VADIIKCEIVKGRQLTLKGVGSVMASIVALNISEKKGTVKHAIEKGYFKVNYGLLGDVHAGSGRRQVSLFGQESMDKIKELELKGFCNVKFVENLTSKGIAFNELSVGKNLKIGEVILEITQIGKECYKGCKMRNSIDTCIMSKEVIFARVLNDGWIKPGDEIEL
jgi:MOSC domain-containing protein YiiM